MESYTVGFWLYSNGGGEEIERQLINKLQERDIAVVTGLNLAHAVAKEGVIVCHDVVMEELDLFLSYNAGKQTPYQMYLYQTLNESIPLINNYDAFALTEDKFRTAHKLNRAGIATPEYRLCNRDSICSLKNTLREWGGRVVYKPTDGWGGVGIVKIENERALDMLLPFLGQADIRHFYVERFINYDNTDYRVDIVDGEVVGCYGRKAPQDDWKTNITSGGSVIRREPDDEVIDLALRAAKVTGLEIAGVDLLYDLEHEQYVVLEVNGIPAFATPEQQKMGLDFNDRKVEKIAQLIDRKVRKTNEREAA
ncbi:ATP-grasp domain-containing protein [Halomonas maura]|uniref:ATP-grasp domain-containing protein n=1 Tax=Halomonas maura TaxID=117606 RepID=UPI0025B2B406|nr:ATP-grasp domain-containing protein [Halomonas maura]MDN3556521.1 ATP-grasp domain-containing protein [Halomonas maura]